MSKEQVISNKSMDEERALYNLKNAELNNCYFSGPQDGESALKEARDIEVNNCAFSLRYPMWHVQTFSMKNSSMDQNVRAALWYSNDGTISQSYIGGVKAVRECNRIKIDNCEIHSAEFGWKCDSITLTNGSISSEYLFLDSENITMKNIRMKGKYSFQYNENLFIEDCSLDTKDAFWHAHNVTVKNSLVKGEYLGWFSDGLTLENCKIIGTQPFCYCSNLKLINCTMDETDLAFEYSDVDADIYSHVVSIKNVKSGRIVVDSVGEIINDDPVMECTGTVIVRK